MSSLPPGTLLILGALLIPLLRGKVRQGWLVVLPVLSFLHLLQFQNGHEITLQMFDMEMHPIRVDRLSLLFGYVFHIAAFLSAIYALHVKDAVQHVSAFIYAGAAIAAVFAGDLITLFVFWELTAVSSVFLIWASRTKRAYRAGMRYLIIQVGSGVLLLAGIMLHDTIDFTSQLAEFGTLGSTLIFFAFGIKAAFPLLHNWLQDAYPEATPTGTVFLSAFTTKLAIYTLARGFPGTESLIWIGAIMTVFPIFYAVLENDLRRVLAYSLNNQLGFMLVGVGIGTELSLNGTAAHAFAHIIYKGLLFMSMGAVLHRTGTIKASKLGGLYKSMPWTAAFCIIGALSISGFPGFSGFISKSMILTAGGDAHLVWLSIVLLFASAGVVDHSGIKIPFFSFFAHDSGIRVKEAPLNMLLAMGGAAAICIGLGLYPKVLYDLLPYPVDYAPFTTTHIVTSAQLLLFAALAFVVLMRVRLYPPEIPSVNLDFDWTYRKAIPNLIALVTPVGKALSTIVERTTEFGFNRLSRTMTRVMGPAGILGRTHSPGATVLWMILVFAVSLLLYFVR